MHSPRNEMGEYFVMNDMSIPSCTARGGWQSDDFDISAHRVGSDNLFVDPDPAPSSSSSSSDPSSSSSSSYSSVTATAPAAPGGAKRKHGEVIFVRPLPVLRRSSTEIIRAAVGEVRKSFLRKRSWRRVVSRLSRRPCPTLSSKLRSPRTRLSGKRPCRVRSTL